MRRNIRRRAGAEKQKPEGEGKRAGFVTGTVFDISQTETTPEREPIDRQRVDELRQDAADVGAL